jgi:hypothetical protein
MYVRVRTYENVETGSTVRAVAKEERLCSRVRSWHNRVHWLPHPITFGQFPALPVIAHQHGAEICVPPQNSEVEIARQAADTTENTSPGLALLLLFISADAAFAFLHLIHIETGWLHGTAISLEDDRGRCLGVVVDILHVIAYMGRSLLAQVLLVVEDGGEMILLHPSFGADRLDQPQVLCVERAVAVG